MERKLWFPTPPNHRPVKKHEIFDALDYRKQVFIYLKYTKNRPKKAIMKNLFIVSDHTYYKLDKEIKGIIAFIFKKDCKNAVHTPSKFDNKYQ